MKVKIDIKDKDIKNLLAECKERARNLKPITRKISLRMKAETHKRFNNEEDPSGKKWKSWSDNTRASKEYYNKLDNAKILQDTGKLKRSIKSDFSGDTASVYSNLVYAKTHQEGKKNIKIVPKDRPNPKNKKKYLMFYTTKGFVLSKAVRVSIPKRQFIGLSKKELKKYKDIILKYLKP